MSNEDPQSASEAEAEAAVWLARLHADDKNRHDERAFRKWLLADQANEQAFAQLTAAWDAAGSTQRAPYSSGINGPNRPIARREFVVAAGALVLVAGGSGYWHAATAGVYKTELGEQRHVTLSDGTLLFLDTDTSVKVRFNEAERKVDLSRGRCNFQVVADRARPFVVTVADQKIVSPQATFDVRRDGATVQVICIDGSATVTGEATQDRVELLKAGERLVAPIGKASRIDKPNMIAAVSWQTGQLVFDDESLAEAVEEMNRYSTTRLVVRDPRAANLKLSGVYRAGDNASFARSAAQLLPITATFGGAEIHLSGRLGPGTQKRDEER